MIVIYWIYRNRKRYRKTYRFVRASAAIGFGLSQGF